MNGKKRIFVLGVTGMLGSMVDAYLRSATRYDVRGTTRRNEAGHIPGAPLPVPYAFDAERDDDAVLERIVEDARPEFVINCIGIIKPYCRDDDSDGVRRAIAVNALFPHRLARVAAAADAVVLQIATDCVYSGRAGGYAEDAPHDALDAYGKTKSLGEVRADNVLHLRCSIIGPERDRVVNLLEWFRSQPDGACVPGFAHHLWNGVTTLQFAQCCAELVERGPEFIRELIRASPVHHLIPNAAVSKYELLTLFADVFQKSVVVERTEEPGPPVNRTLASRFRLLPFPYGERPMREAIAELRQYMTDHARHKTQVAAAVSTPDRT